jgi:hypothetical protein
VVRAAAKPAVKVAGLTGFRAKLVQSKRGPARIRRGELEAPGSRERGRETKVVAALWSEPPG